MTNEFTAIVERDGEWYISYCPEVPGANGQGKTKEEALESLSEAIALILEDRREEGLRGVPPKKPYLSSRPRPSAPPLAASQYFSPSPAPKLVGLQDLTPTMLSRT